MNTSNEKTGGPAFPADWHNDSDANQIAPDGRVVPAGGVVGFQGMTLRDYFAAQAVSGRALAKMSVNDIRNMGVRAYELADAMLAARK